MTAVSKEVIVSKAIPFGSIPSNAVEVATTEFFIGKFLIRRALMIMWARSG
jgi:hypothetical protein